MCIRDRSGYVKCHQYEIGFLFDIFVHCLVTIVTHYWNPTASFEMTSQAILCHGVTYDYQYSLIHFVHVALTQRVIHEQTGHMTSEN